MEPYLHRVGMSVDLTDNLLTWAENLGLVTALRDTLTINRIGYDGEARTWWIERFENSWASDLSYMTPDDD